MKKMLYPHRCNYHHSWEITVDTRQGDYPDPLQRFCHECVQEGRIEVGSLQIMSTLSGIPRLHLVCGQCLHTMMVPVIPEWNLTFLTDDTDFFMRREEKPYWFHLPSIWPRCMYCQESLTLKQKEIIPCAQ